MRLTCLPLHAFDPWVLDVCSVSGLPIRPCGNWHPERRGSTHERRHELRMLRIALDLAKLPLTTSRMKTVNGRSGDTTIPKRCSLSFSALREESSAASIEFPGCRSCRSCVRPLGSRCVLRFAMTICPRNWHPERRGQTHQRDEPHASDPARSAKLPDHHPNEKGNCRSGRFHPEKLFPFIPRIARGIFSGLDGSPGISLMPLMRPTPGFLMSTRE